MKNLRLKIFATLIGVVFSIMLFEPVLHEMMHHHACESSHAQDVEDCALYAFELLTYHAAPIFVMLWCFWYLCRVLRLQNPSLCVRRVESYISLRAPPQTLEV